MHDTSKCVFRRNLHTILGHIAVPEIFAPYFALKTALTMHSNGRLRGLHQRDRLTDVLV